MFYTRQLPPTVIDVAYEVGDLWLDQPSGRVWRYAGPGQWEPWSTSAGKPVGAEQLFPGPDGSDIGLADAPTSDGLYALGVDGGDIEWAEIEGLPPVGDDGDVLTVVDGAWAAGPAGPAGPDPTGATAGHVWTADGDDGADWAAPSGGGGGGGGGWTSISNPGAVVPVNDSGVVISEVALDGAELVEGARLDWRAAIRVDANPAPRNLTGFFVQLLDADGLGLVYATLASIGASAINGPAADSCYYAEGSAYIESVGGEPVTFTAHSRYTFGAVSADFGRLQQELLSPGTFSTGGDPADLTRLTIRCVANGGTDLEVQALELAYQITPPTE